MQTDKEVFARGRLTAKPGEKISGQTALPGLQSLGLDSRRDGLIYVPARYNQAAPAAFALMLHGAGGNAEHGISLIEHLADEANIILLAPVSRSVSWDIISSNRFGSDVAFINQALTRIFYSYNIDPLRLAIGGFSDGASYALSVGLTNGDLFSHIIAFSPGFFYTIEINGRPPVYISHGTSDDILPINSCSRRIVPRLQKQGYHVVFEEFDGPHNIPSYVSLNAVTWFLK